MRQILHEQSDVPEVPAVAVVDEWLVPLPSLAACPNGRSTRKLRRVSALDGHVEEDRYVNPTYPGGGDADREPDPEATPSLLLPTGSEANVTSHTLEVDGEMFAIRPSEFGGTDYTWLSGPNPGYGFTQSPTPDLSADEHRTSIRAFLSMVDPGTGYIEDH